MIRGLMRVEMMIVAFFATVLIGCGGGGAGVIPTPTLPTEQAHFVDMKARGITYRATVTDKENRYFESNGSVDNNGVFKYFDGGKTYFYMGDYLIGAITKINSDGYIFVQDIIGADRESGLKNTEVINLSKILLSIDTAGIKKRYKAVILNNFDIKNATDGEMDALLVSIGVVPVTQLYAKSYLKYHYRLITSAPLLDKISRVTSTMCIDVNDTAIPDMFSDFPDLNSVEVYMDGLHQGRLTKDIDKTRHTLNIKLGNGTENFDRAREFAITFRNNNTGSKTTYESPNFDVVVPSPMLGRWVDSITRKVVYLKSESELPNYEFKDINQLEDTTTDGRYLLRAGIGDINIFGSIKKLSTISNELQTIDMKIKHVKSGITQQYRLVLADSSHVAGSIGVGSNALDTLYVDGNSTEYIIPRVTTNDIEHLRVITGENEIYIQETTVSGATISQFNISHIVGNTYDFGTLNITDSTVSFNIVSKLKEGNDYLYYGYLDENKDDKPIEYRKTLQVCNNGNSIISAARVHVMSSHPELFREFSVASLGMVGIANGTCIEMPMKFSFKKPNKTVDINLTVEVTSGSLSWSDHMVMTLSDETFIKLYFISKNIPLNSFISLEKEGRLFAHEFTHDALSYTMLPRLEAKSYRMAVAKQTDENSFVVGIDMVPDSEKFQSDTDIEKSLSIQEPMNNTYYSGGVKSCMESLPEIGAQTMALRYGEAMGYITYRDIDYFTLDSIPAVTHKYSSFKTDSSDSSGEITWKSDIVLPFYIQIDDADIDSFVKLFVKDGAEITALTKRYNRDTATLTISNIPAVLTESHYTIKLLKGLKSMEDTNAVLLQDQEWDIEFKKTNMVSTGQTKSYATHDDGSYQSGVSVVQSRDDTLDIVTDMNTKLVWQDNNDTHSVTKNKVNALNYCTDLSHAGHSDWRLPSREELISIVDYTKSYPSIDSSFKFVVEDGIYLSSTQVAGSTDDAWYVEFRDGKSYYSANDSTVYNIRCVRGATGSIYSSDYVKPTNSDYVTDRDDTYLLWQDDGNAGQTKKSWADAIEYCEALNLRDESGTYTGTVWRLPNINELATIIDDAVSGSSTPAIIDIFSNTAAEVTDRYWSSTTVASNSDSAWAVGFTYGTHVSSTKSGSNFVRCVSRGSL